VQVALPVAVGVLSGDVVVVGAALTGLAITDRDSTGYATVRIACPYTFTTTVTGADNAGNSAVAIGDRLYKDGAEVNKDATNGKLCGLALGVVSSGGSAVIEVAATL
jgi:hypothetical protein